MGYERRRGRRETQSLHVRGYDVERIGEEDMRNEFSKFGPVADVYMPRHFHTKKLRGFTYVQFERERDAEDARRELDRSDMFRDGRIVNVMWAAGERKSPEDMQRMDRERAAGLNPSARGPRRVRLDAGDSRGGYRNHDGGYGRGRYSPRDARGGSWDDDRALRGGPRGNDRSPRDVPRGHDRSPREAQHDPPREAGRDHYISSRKRSRSPSGSPHRSRSYSPPREYSRRRLSDRQMSPTRNYQSRYSRELDYARSPPRRRESRSPSRRGSRSPPRRNGRTPLSPRGRRARSRSPTPPYRVRNRSPGPQKRSNGYSPELVTGSPPRGVRPQSKSPSAQASRSHSPPLPRGYGAQRLKPLSSGHAGLPKDGHPENSS